MSIDLGILLPFRNSPNFVAEFRGAQMVRKSSTSSSLY
jgi:hypothetical protein